jgi:UDP:flavonoid glycosyltransferase YjiC (YdhE family)
VLDQPSFREAAHRIRDSLLTAGGSQRAAALVEELL